ncbi:MAG: hypothetical protein HYX55_07285 [Chloroflexi bacterium]|nr:hypothetical protein [Chloroflexota bacterium]
MLKALGLSELKGRGAVVGVLLLLVAYGAGYLVRNTGRIDLVIYTSRAVVGADQATFEVGGTSYSFETSVAWTDRSGTEWSSGWPDCLPKLQTVELVRFGAATVWHDNVGFGRVLWVDCRPVGMEG